MNHITGVPHRGRQPSNDPEGLLRRLLPRLAATQRQYLLYMAVYLVWGLISNSIGKLFAIAAFLHWWQVFTCYVVYLVPVSLLLRHHTRLEQYVYGVLALAPLELVGYSIGSSIAYDGNVIDMILGPRNFTLAMCVFFGIIPPVGNGLVAWIEARCFGAAEVDQQAA